MSNIRVDLSIPIYDGLPVTFKSPTDCSKVTGLIIYYPSGDTTVSKVFQFADAHGNNVGSVNLFASNVLVKVILDTKALRAYVQNADTNAYLEGRFAMTERMYIHNDFIAPICADDGESFALMDDDGNIIVADWQFEEKGNFSKELAQVITNLEYYIDSKVKSITSQGIASQNHCAGSHNSVYRGKNLGSVVTPAQYASIKAGTFDDLYIGDYWVINGVNWRIAAFDYFLNCGDTSCTTHHVTVVPDTCLYNHVMNDSNVTTGGYAGSKMYTQGLEQAKTLIKVAFGNDHILKHRVYLTNTVSNGKPSAGAWYDGEVNLMCEEMVYGTGIFRPTSDGSTVPYNYRVEKTQLPLFAHEPSRICNRVSWWLRDIVSATDFCFVYAYGVAHSYNASASRGVRPAFSIVS